MAFPFYDQRDSADCGATCLRMIAKFYGRRYGMDYLREKASTSKRGASLHGISEAAESIGFHTQGAKISWKQLQHDVPLPCIIHWREQHFVVVHKIKNRKNPVVHVADPAFGMMQYKIDEFLSGWSGGIVLLLEPTPEFFSRSQEVDEPKNIAFKYLFHYLNPYKRYIFQVILGIAVGIIITMALPFLTQAIVDTGVNNNDLGFIFTILVAQIFLNVGKTVTNLIQSRIMLHVTSRVSIKMISGLLMKLLRLPIAFFYKRTIGDIMQRINDQMRIQTFVTETILNVVFSALSIVTFSFILFQFNTTILLIFYLGSLIYLAFIFLFLRKRARLDYNQFEQKAAIQNNLIQLVTGAQEIRLNGCEKQKRWNWEKLQFKLFNIDLKSIKLSQAQQLGSEFIDQTKNIIISFISAKAVVHGDMTLGTMMSVQYIIGQLNSPIQQFVGFIQSAQDAKLSGDRLDDIYNKSNEETPLENRITDIPSRGIIKFKDVVFQYDGPDSPRVLDGISFTVPQGKVTAIVGSSGGGKTTILKLILGIYKPTGGDITLDGISLDSYSPAQWRKNCAAVMQEGFIFSESISSNIAIGDDHPALSRIQRAAKIANIQEFIEELPSKYQTKIGHDGHGLSTGQRQRILIARAVYRDTPFVLLDEATNSLDTVNEATIVENLNTVFLGKTVVIIAHRLSTIKKADQIIHIHGGKVSEVGSHDELVNYQNGYFSLIKSQL